MKRTRTSIAILAILVLIAAALVPGGTPHVAVLAAALLLLPFTLTLTRRWAAPRSTHPNPLARSLVLLRAPPSPSINR